MELISREADQLVWAELLESLHDLGAGGYESGVGRSQKLLPFAHFRIFLATRDNPSPLHLSDIF